jgi:hypothetical protein
MIDCNEWKTEKRHEFTNMGKVKQLNDGNCMSHDFRSDRTKFQDT